MIFLFTRRVANLNRVSKTCFFHSRMVSGGFATNPPLKDPPLEFQHFEITENDDQSEEKIIILQYAFSKTIKYCKIIYTKKSKSHF